MALLLAIIVGVVGGVLLGYVIQGTFASALLNSILGLMGALLGDALYAFTTFDFSFLFTWGGLLSQLLGAGILVFIVHMLRRATPESVKRHASEEHIHRQE